MHLEAHAGLGWLIGCLVPGADRRLRAWCVGAAVLPDIDAVSYLWGPEAYMNYHHTFGHNIFLGVLFAVGAALHHRSRGGRRMALAAAVVAACFGSHLLTDMRLSAYPVHLLWPLSHAGYEFTPNWGLAHWLNTALIYVSIGIAILLGPLRGVTPFELISARLDRIVRSFFSKRLDKCATCERPTNVACDACGNPTCFRHGAVDLRFRITCPACATRKKE